MGKCERTLRVAVLYALPLLTRGATRTKASSSEANRPTP